MIYSRITGIGSYLPDKTMSNHDIAKLVDTTDEWIIQRTGIKQRHIASDSETASILAYNASLQAIEHAKIKQDDIDLIIVATCTPDYFFPSTACLVQKKLKIKKTIPAFDVSAACAGFLYALDIADNYIKSGAVNTALVVGTEVLSRAVDWTDRRTCILFGDGAGAVILQQSNETGILSTHLHADGKHDELLYLRNSLVAPPQCSKAYYAQMLGNEVFKLAVNKLEESVIETLEHNNLISSDINWFVPHQANYRIISALAKKLKLPMKKIILTVQEHGNTAAASIPLALDYGVKEGKIQKGQLLLLEALGGGMAWGSSLIKY